MTRRLGELTAVEAAEAVPASPVVLIPAGAFEQHGPGLPLATDLLRADHVVGRVAAAVGDQVVIGPPVPAPSRSPPRRSPR